MNSKLLTCDDDKVRKETYFQKVLINPKIFLCDDDEVRRGIHVDCLIKEFAIKLVTLCFTT